MPASGKGARTVLPSAGASKHPKMRYGAIEVTLKTSCSMLILYALTALMGGLMSCVLLWPYGAGIALLSMPIGGSLLTLLAAILVYMRTSDEAGRNGDPAPYGDQAPELQITERR